MATITEIYMKKETLEVLLKTLNTKNEKGISLSVVIQDEINSFGQNVTAYVRQSKEDRDLKKPKFYVGNGKVNWTEGVIKVAKKTEQTPSNNVQPDEDLPF